MDVRNSDHLFTQNSLVAIASTLTQRGGSMAQLSVSGWRMRGWVCRRGGVALVAYSQASGARHHSKYLLTPTCQVNNLPINHQAIKSIILSGFFNTTVVQLYIYTYLIMFLIDCATTLKQLSLAVIIITTVRKVW